MSRESHATRTSVLFASFASSREKENRRSFRISGCLRQSIAFSPRAFRGEKVSQADEGCRAIGWHEVSGRRDVSAQLSFGNVAATSNAPLSDLRPPSPPQKAW